MIPILGILVSVFGLMWLFEKLRPKKDDEDNEEEKPFHRDSQKMGIAFWICLVLLILGKAFFGL